jgi:tripartite-type tricarboxylate transporter receptor subunit TctC
MAAAATPKDIVEKMNAAVTKVMTSPATRDYQARIGADPMPMSAAEFEAFVKRDIDTQRKWITDAKITL